MELERVQKSLTIKNDINVLTKDELRQKYMRDPNTYKDFLECFKSIFVGRHLYPLLIYREYDRLSDLISEHLDDINRSLSETIIAALKKEKEFAGNLEESEDRYGQGLSLFKEPLGANKLNQSYNFKQLTEKMLSCVNTMAEGSTDELSKDDFRDYLEMAMDHGSLSINPQEKTQILLKNYLRAHPRIKLCYDPMFLVTANYLMSTKLFNPDSEFIELVRTVIDISENVPISKDFMPNFDSKEYHRVAKVTNKKLESIELSNAKEDNSKKKMKSFFQKRTK